MGCLLVCMRKQEKENVNAAHTQPNNTISEETKEIESKVQPLPLPVIKVIMVGDTNVGKSCMSIRYTEGRFESGLQQTIGIDFKNKNVETEGESVRLQIWDPSGQKRYRDISTSYFKGSKGVILVFDLTSKSSFQSLPDWMKEIKLKIKESIPIILVGNKSDLRSQQDIPSDVIKGLANHYQLPYYETSAKDGSNIDEVFLDIANRAWFAMKSN